MKLCVFSDGGSRGNPGPAAVGVVCYQDKKIVFEFGKLLGETTNNVAEYTAVIEGLKRLQKLLESNSGVTQVLWQLDSKLVVEQLARRWKIKEPHLQQLATTCWQALDELKIPCTFVHIPREKNSYADGLVNTALDAP
ncbi:MAG: ribonuclease HI family protein [Candidatus Pacebacteria bacterium]|nr:ribonuclease HI family protein [Candidatus Paceibacterota bacterium]PIR60899.1 MAG: ribonuclease H [Candidatus Pacebacteria bacterium CG10_big_fil_rev_8_21_14_0_10_44_54]